MDGLDDLRQVQREAEALTRDPRPAIGTDGTGTVEVRVDGAGQLAAVKIHRDWRRRLSPETVAPAVLAAREDALTNQAAALAADYRRPQEAAVPPPEPVSPPARPRRSGPGPDGRLQELLMAVSDGLAEFSSYTEHLEASAQRRIAGRSRSGRVTVTLTGRQITELTIDVPWLRTEASGRQIGDEIESACRQAYTAVAEDDEAAAARTPHLHAIRDLARDPQEFLRRLTRNEPEEATAWEIPNRPAANS